MISLITFERIFEARDHILTMFTCSFTEWMFGYPMNLEIRRFVPQAEDKTMLTSATEKMNPSPGLARARGLCQTHLETLVRLVQVCNRNIHNISMLAYLLVHFNFEKLLMQCMLSNYAYVCSQFPSAMFRTCMGIPSRSTASTC